MSETKTKETWSFIESHLRKLREPALGSPKQPTYWPSEASAIATNEYGEDEVLGACRRSTFFRYASSCHAYEPEKYVWLDELIRLKKDLYVPESDYMRFIWEMGSMFETYVINAAKTSKVFEQEQVPIYSREHNISGKIDLIVRDPFTDMLTPVEIKSVYGMGASKTIGTASMFSNGAMGTPKDSNLMQIALYDWLYCSSHRDLFEYSRLLYGGRDTGSFGEYRVASILNRNTNEIEIFYKGIYPIEAETMKARFTVSSILNQFIYITDHLENLKTVPPKDFQAEYSPEKIQQLYERNLLSKTDKEQHEKHIAREKEREAAAISGEKQRPTIKPVIKGDWQCNYCSNKRLCSVID